MSVTLNSVEARGDDIPWKREASRAIENLQRQVELLSSQLSQRGGH
jgi:hypothetical protein